MAEMAEQPVVSCALATQCKQSNALVAQKGTPSYCCNLQYKSSVDEFKQELQEEKEKEKKQKGHEEAGTQWNMGVGVPVRLGQKLSSWYGLGGN